MKHNIRQHVINQYGLPVTKIETVHGELGSGVIDKNGKEIFECDSVIRILELNDDGELVHVEAFPMQATFDDFSAINNGEIILVEPYRYDSQNKTA